MGNWKNKWRNKWGFLGYTQWIGSGENFNRKTPYLMVKNMVSCKFSLKLIHWYTNLFYHWSMFSTCWTIPNSFTSYLYHLLRNRAQMIFLEILKAQVILFHDDEKEVAASKAGKFVLLDPNISQPFPSQRPQAIWVPKHATEFGNMVYACLS